MTLNNLGITIGLVTEQLGFTYSFINTSLCNPHFFLIRTG